MSVFRRQSLLPAAMSLATLMAFVGPAAASSDSAFAPVELAQARDTGSSQGANSARIKPLSPDDRAILKRVQDYLNSIETLEARFTQVDSTNKKASGRIYLSRPGKLRFEYDPPVPVLIVTDGRFLIHYDRDLKTASRISQRDTPAWFLLSPTVELQGDVTVTEVNRSKDKVLVTLVKTSEPGQGRVTLVLNEDPMQLEQWAVTDAQGIVTYVTLEDAEFGKPIDSSRFTFNEPVWTDK